jgi:EXLDI family protein
MKPPHERYDAAVPNKTIYVSDGDLSLFQRAQELAGGNLSAAIAKALRRYVDTAEGLQEGFDDVVVRVGVGSGRKVRFTGVLVGEWVDSRDKRVGHYRVWRGRTGKYVLHVERGAEWWAVDSDGKEVAGWRSWMGVGDVRYGSAPRESTLEVVPTLDELSDKVPPELFDMVARTARQPTVEELDI